MWAFMQQEAATIFPHGTPQNFSWKYRDCDSLDPNGNPYSAREGQAGCFIVTYSSELSPPRVMQFDTTSNSYQTLLTDAQGKPPIKTGDFIRVATSINAHKGKTGNTNSVPGLYMNPELIEFVGYGQEIVGGPDANEVFGGQQQQLPPGASATPVASGPMPTMAPGMPAANPTMPAGSPPAIAQPVGSPMMPAQPQMQPPGAPAAVPPQMPQQPAPMPPGVGVPPASPSDPHNPMGQPLNPMQAPGGGVTGAAPATMNPAGSPTGTKPPSMTASPSNVVPAHDFVQNAQAPGMTQQPQPMQQPQQQPIPTGMPGMPPQQ